MSDKRFDVSEHESFKAEIEEMLAVEKKATKKPWTVVRQGRDTPEGWREWLDVWGPDGNETLHLVALAGGQFALLPSHKIMFGDGEEPLPDYKKLRAEWRVGR